LAFPKGKKQFRYRDKRAKTNKKITNDILKENFAFHLNKSIKTCSQGVSR
jgi:hypothetical protein